jgi:predicted nucleotidyltransferase
MVARFMSMVSNKEHDIEAVYFFGSRNRKDHRPDSDYDLLIVVKEKKKDLVNVLYDAVIELLLETGRLFSLKIIKLGDFKRLSSLPTPFMKTVMEEGMRIG